MDLGRWHTLMDQFGLPANDDTFEALVVAYSEKHRHYHNQSHIDAVLKHLDDVRDLADAPHEIELALWFHDAIYEIFSSNNELDSANWAAQFLANNGAHREQILRIHGFITATLHTELEGRGDKNLMVDIDLAILGAPQHIYDEFEQNIRKEYRLVPFFLYRKKRKEILQNFLDRDRIFKTHYFYARLEKQARKNLSRTIGSL